MRKRINRALFATTVAGVSITTLGFLAMSASASAAPRYFNPSGGTPIGTDANCTQSSPPIPSDNCAMAGYEASGRDFRYAQAVINVPDATLTTSDDGYGALYVSLDGSGTNTYQYTRVGIAPCPTSKTSWHIVPGDTATDCATLAGDTAGWVAFTATADAGSTPVIATHPIAGSLEGDGVFVSVYLVPTGNAVHTVITVPSTSATYNNTFAITGPVYTDAMAVEDWTTNVENADAKPLPAVPSVKTRDAQFFQGRFTTTSGTAGTFSDGSAWKVNALEATSNGTLPNSGTLIGQPSYLWSDGSGYKGMGDDAFGVWRYPF